MKKINRTTYQSSAPEHLEVVVGDEKQTDFYPRIKIKKWDNEANLSIGTLDTGGTQTLDGDKIVYNTPDKTVRFYTPSSELAPTLTNKLRYLNLGQVQPWQVPAEYELSRHIKTGDLTVATYRSSPGLMYVGQYLSSDYTGIVDIPEVRAASAKGNPFYMDEGLAIIDIHYNGHDPSVGIKWNQATKEILANYGVDVFGDTKLYYKDPDGNDVKISSSENNWGHLWTYVNIDCNYLKAYDYYKADRPKDIRDEYAYGLKRHYPAITNDVVNEIAVRFAELTNLTFTPDTYTTAEQAKIDSLQAVMTSTEWVHGADRNDLDWWFDQPKSDFEFEIELNHAPSSNIVPLSVTTKGLEFYYQPKQREENAYRPPWVEGSYAVYHASKSNNQYKTGKAFHIFRPWAVDATGKKVWCSFNPEWDGVGNLNITVPQDFIDNAVYPIIIDPTFGYNTAGGTNVILDDTIVGTLHTSTEAGEMQSLSMYLDTSGSMTCEYEGALYTAATGALVAQTDNGATVSGPLLKTVNFAAEGFNNGTDYYISAWGQGTGGAYGVITLRYDSTSGKTSKQFNKEYAVNAWPNTIDWDSTDNNRQYSIYITYGTTLVIDLHDGTSQVSGPKIV